MQVGGRVLRASARLGTPRQHHAAPENRPCKAVSLKGERLQAHSLEARVFLLSECWGAFEGWEFGVPEEPSQT